MNTAAAYFMTMFSVLGARFEGRKDRGATAVEYGLMVGLIAVAIIVTVGLLGDDLNAMFEDVRTKLSGTTTTP